MTKLHYHIFFPLSYSSKDMARTSDALLRLVPYGTPHPLNHCKTNTKLHLLYKHSFKPQPWPWRTSDNIYISTANPLNTKTPLRCVKRNVCFAFLCETGRSCKTASWRERFLHHFGRDEMKTLFIVLSQNLQQFVGIFNLYFTDALKYWYTDVIWSDGSLRVISSSVYKHLIAMVIVLIKVSKTIHHLHNFQIKYHIRNWLILLGERFINSF